MCAGAIALARVSRLYFGAADPKRGAVVSGVRLFAQPTCHHAPEIYPGIGEEEAGEMLRAFFRERRQKSDSHSFSFARYRRRPPRPKKSDCHYFT